MPQQLLTEDRGVRPLLKPYLRSDSYALVPTNDVDAGELTVCLRQPSSLCDFKTGQP
jgi:hypothetical protein